MRICRTVWTMNCFVPSTQGSLIQRQRFFDLFLLIECCEPSVNAARRRKRTRTDNIGMKGRKNTNVRHDWRRAFPICVARASCECIPHAMQAMTDANLHSTVLSNGREFVHDTISRKAKRLCAAFVLEFYGPPFHLWETKQKQRPKCCRRKQKRKEMLECLLCLLQANIMPSWPIETVWSLASA